MTDRIDFKEALRWTTYHASMPHQRKRAIKTALRIADRLQSKYVIDGHKFLQHTEAVLYYHADDKEFCENYRKDIDELTKEEIERKQDG